MSQTSQSNMLHTNVFKPKRLIISNLPPRALPTYQNRIGIFKVCNYTLCRDQAVKWLSWHPQHPNPTLPMHPISAGNKAKPVMWIWNNTSSLLFVTPGDHKWILIIQKIENLFLFSPGSLSHIPLVTFHSFCQPMKWPPKLPRTVLIQLISCLRHLMTTETRGDVRSSPAVKCWLFEIACTPYAYFIPEFNHCRSNE